MQSYFAQLERAAHRSVGWQTVQDVTQALDLKLFLVPRERVPELQWLLDPDARDEAPPLNGGLWDN